MEIFDLSHTIDNDTLVYPGDPKPEIIRIADFDTDGYTAHKLILNTHLSTHIDSPAHVLNNGRTLDDFPLAHFTGSAYIAEAKYSANREIYFDFPDKIEFEHLIINTGWNKKWGTPEYFTDYPVLSVSTAELIANRQIKSVGFDTCSVDRIEHSDFLIHRIFLKKNILIIENLSGLEPLNNTLVDLFVFPLKLKSIDGSPIRAVAIKK